jgi:chaperonin cofactor prefoldin
MENKEKLLQKRADALDKQEKEFSEKLEKIRDEVIGNDKE